MVIVYHCFDVSVSAFYLHWRIDLTIGHIIVFSYSFTFHIQFHIHRRGGGLGGGGQEGQSLLLEKSRRGKTIFLPLHLADLTPTTYKLVSANREFGAFYWFLDIKAQKIPH